jgi:hypothetical protein
MVDAVLDEEHIVALLTCDIKVENVNRIQAGAVQTILDLYDRKTTREEFIKLCSPCIALYGQMAKLWMLHNMKHLYLNGDITEERLDHAVVGMEGIITTQIETVIGIVRRLQECPDTGDTIN